MADHTLHCFAQSGNAYKAALMLNLCGADWEARFVDFFNGATRTPEFRQINEMGEVPVLEHDGNRLSQSGVILDYLAAHFGRFGWTDDDERRLILRWLLWDNHKLTSYTATYRFMTQFAGAGDSEVAKFMRERMTTNLKVLNRHLDGSTFVVAERPTIADLSISGYLFWPEELGVDWAAEHPAIDAWLDRLQALPGWVHPYELMPGHPLPKRS
jgi:glutathione S-transferase